MDIAPTDFYDTIAAIATPPGTGGVAIIRISGDGALNVLNKMFVAKAPFEHARMVYGSVTDGGSVIDTGYAVYFAAPKSYTGEDTAELHIHGGYVGTARVLDRAIKCGARTALPGEFSRRAFINGKMDLTEAEAVCDYIGAEGEACAKESVRQMRGALGASLQPITDAMLELVSSAEAVVEYPEEDLEDALEQGVSAALPQLIRQIETLARTYSEGRLMREGVRVAIAGKPNVGKSSLLNALTRERRAIVSDTPGTTRDIVEARAVTDGYVFKFQDTAGIRECADDIERQGVELARGAISGADIVLLVLDSSRPLEAEDGAALNSAAESGARVITLLNKVDIPTAVTTADDARRFTDGDVLSVSALRQDCADIIFDALKAAAACNTAEGSVTIINARHAELLSRAAAALRDAQAALNGALDAECVLTDLKEALSALYEITGQSVNEEVIDRIFSRFCLGK